MSGSRNRRNAQQSDDDLTRALQQSAATYRQEQLQRYQNGIEITMQIMPISTAADPITTQYPEMLGSEFAATDYIILPKRFSNTVYSDTNSNFQSGLTVLKYTHAVTGSVTFLTLRGFITNDDQEFAYVDNAMFTHLDIQFGQFVQLIIVPNNELLPGIRVVLTPDNPQQFLHVPDQSTLVEGYLGVNYRILSLAQRLTVPTISLPMHFTVTELYADHPINGETPMLATQPAIITDTNLEIEFRVSDEDLAKFAESQRPLLPPYRNGKQRQRFRIRGILPTHLERMIDDIEQSQA